MGSTHQTIYMPDVARVRDPGAAARRAGRHRRVTSADSSSESTPERPPSTRRSGSCASTARPSSPPRSPVSSTSPPRRPPDGAAQHIERAFENAIEEHLLGHGWHKGNPDHFDRALALDAAEVIRFIADTQPSHVGGTEAQHGDGLEKTVIEWLVEALDTPGDARRPPARLRFHGQVAPRGGVQAEPRPQPGPRGRSYARNRLTVTRQVKFDPASEKSLDMVLSLNGLPIATVELKNPLTGAERPARHRAVQERPRPTAPHLPVQEAGAGPLRRRSRRRLHGDGAPGEGHLLPALQQGERHRRRGTPRSTPGNTRRATSGSEVWERDSFLDILAPLHPPPGRGAGRRRQGRDRRDDDLPAVPPARRGAEAGGRGACRGTGPQLPRPALRRQRQVEQHRLARVPARRAAPGRRAGLPLGRRGDRPPCPRRATPEHDLPVRPHARAWSRTSTRTRSSSRTPWRRACPSSSRRSRSSRSRRRRSARSPTAPTRSSWTRRTAPRAASRRRS